ncbi:tellurite resistance TerB C-terminal domain-containing protein [Flavobacterium sp. UBA7680]|uniref:tellurite resistance TerB C-terminal domain-containing protein n=1 Tax=Flavobacterium sp. UBA7680 TaxID=1946559 RepID=UPI0025BDB652|nr:tellurite resistance TerB C-terminal domain-containing protein [Flavobacterium sp. UBA7680]
MTIIIIIFIIIVLVSVGKKKPEPNKVNYYDIAKNQRTKQISSINRTNMINVSVTKSSSKIDDSIIDVGSQSYRIDSDYGLESKVPYWSHSYVYSYSEINYATSNQKKFYQYYKTQFLNGQFIDLEGNTNYAFILLFDLLNEFDQHKNIILLESQLEILGNHYPKTKTYGINFLIKKMEQVGDTDGVARLREDHYDYQYTQVNYSTFEWRNKYKKKLNLTKDETNVLDKIWYSSNNFVNIEYCCVEVIRLYLATMNSLKQLYVDNGSSIEKEFEEIADVVVRKHFRYRKGSNNYKHAIQSCENEFHTNIFKFCENTVREKFGHKRKITIDPYASSLDAKEEFETKLISKIAQIHFVLISKINLPDKETEIKLNLQNTTRWKAKFEEISSGFNKDSKEFLDQIIELGKLNKENPSVENIFFEASKFIAKYDQETALSLYLHYLDHDLQSITFDNKQLTKTIQKSLFKDNIQLENFERIVSEFIYDKDLRKALSSVPQVYAVKRKKIQLDKSLIKEVQQQHSGTVELLNEYLRDENSEELDSKSVLDEQIEISIDHSKTEETISIYSKDFVFKPIHTSTLEFFSKNNYSILQSEFEIFAKSKGAFKNQLIENINEICFENLDDLLIEEDEEYYTINQDYYQKLLAK